MPGNSRFTDEIHITVKAGNGGPGCVSFRHEKYVEFGGPDGGDGGRGGDVYLRSDHRILTFSHLRNNKIYSAEDGRSGEGHDRHGRDGEDLTIKVPIGTQVFDVAGDLVADFTDDEQQVLLVRGARGGKGNAFFKTATHQAPKFAQPGEQTLEAEYTLSLKLLADIGFVGFPNAGKSTLLKALTNARPKIANYPFTTLSPNLGVIDDGVSRRVTLADIPGIIEGAARGSGLGLAFLKHIERVRLIVYVLDGVAAHGKEDLHILQTELSAYNPELLTRPSVIVFNKTDQIDDPVFLQEYLESFRGETGIQEIFPISALTGDGVDALRSRLLEFAAKSDSSH